MPQVESKNLVESKHHEIKTLRKVLIWFGIAIALFVVLDLNYILYSIRFALNPTKRVDLANQTESAKNLLPANYLYIESLDIKVPIVYVKEKSEKSYQAGLKNGVVHYPLTALPGQTGNVYIFGHSSDYIWSDGKYKTIFAALPKIQIGDNIQVSDNLGNNYMYKVQKSFVSAADNVSLLSQETKGKKLLTLQTSWPLGTALRRWIVIAELK